MPEPLPWPTAPSNLPEASVFKSYNTLSGYGTISAPVNNYGTTTLTGGTSNVSGAFTNESGGNLNVKTNPATFSTVTNNAGGTVFVDHATATWGNFTNNGAYISDPSTQTFNSLTVGSTGYLTGAAGDVFQIKGDFINNSTQNTLWNTAAAQLDFITGTSPPHLRSCGGGFRQYRAGYTNNFAWGTWTLPARRLTLPDGNAATWHRLVCGANPGRDLYGVTVTDITGDGFNIQPHSI